MAQDRIDPNAIQWTGAGAQKEDLDTRKGEAQIGSSNASAASSAASAERTRTLTPIQAKKEQALTNVAQLNADKLKMALQKAQQQLDGRPAPENLRQMQEDLLYKLGIMSQALKLSRESPTATGFGSGLVSKIGDTSAATVAELMKTIGGSEAFKKLAEMRATSPTGAAVGNVTEKELDLLASSSAAIGTSSDEAFQEGITKLISDTINVLNKLGAEPAEVASKLNREDLPQFVDKLQSYRLLPGDVKKISAYVDDARKKGTYDPSDYAALMSEAFYNATGRKPDEAFVKGALETGVKLAQDPNVSLTDIDYTPADVEVRKRIAGSHVERPEAERSWGSTALDATFNFVPSTFNLAYDTVKALTVDLPDTVEGIAKVIGGATGLSDDTETWDALKDYYKGRYGSAEGFKKALATDPAAILADIAGLATGGATVIAKTAGVAGKVSKIAALSEAARAAEQFGTVAAKLDPITGTVGAINQAKGLTNLGGAVGDAALNIPTKMAGVTNTDVKQAFSAGKRNSQDFASQLEGTGDVMDPLAKAEAAVGELYQTRSRDYTRRMNKVNKAEKIDWTDVEKAIDDAEAIGKHKGIDISSAADVWQEIFDVADQFRAQGLDTLEDFDALKRAVRTIGAKYQVGTPQHTVAKNVSSKINDVIVAKAPVYANIMKEYRIASDTLSDIKASASIDAKSADTTLGKLQRMAAGKGPRGQTVLQLLESTKSGKGLGDMLAGQNLSGREAGGFAPTIAGPAALAAGDPTVLAGTMISPRSLGKTAFGLGRTYGIGETGVNAIRGTRPVQSVEARAAQLASKYGAPAMAGVRMANPVIQAQVDPFVAPQPGQMTEQALAELRQRYAPTPRAVLGDPRRVTLGSLRSAAPSAGISLEGISLDEEPTDEEVVQEYARGGRVIAPIGGF